MDKNELIETIQQTITPNGLKAITAETLANVLLEIVEAIGENSGSGQVVFYAGIPNEDRTEFTLTDEEKAHNVKMFDIIKQSPIALSASVDCSRMAEADLEDEGLDVSGFKYNEFVYATQYIPYELAGLEGFESDCIVLVSFGGSFIVTPDGSVHTFE